MTDEPALGIAAAAFPSLVGATDHGEFIAPKMREVFEALAAIAAPCVDRRIIAHHAAQVHVAALHLAADVGVGSFEIGGDRNRGFAARPARGIRLAHGVARLKRAAASGSLVRWLKAWAAASNETRRRIIAQMDGRTTRGVPPDWVSFSAPGYVTNAPPARAARIAIARVEGEMRAVPAARRRTRKADPFKSELLNLERAAFIAVAGRAPGLTWSVYEDRYAGAFMHLVQTIDAIYGTAIVSARTPTRLRAKRK